MGLKNPNTVTMENSENLYQVLHAYYWDLMYYWRGNEDIDHHDIVKKFLADTGVLVSKNEYIDTRLHMRVIDVDKLTIWRMSH